MLSEDYQFKLIEKYMKNKNQATIQLNSYNNFLQFRIHDIIKNENQIEIPIEMGKYIIKFRNIMIDKPYIINNNRIIKYITPNECRMRDISYDSVLSINIDEITIDREGKIIEHKIHNKIPIARLPIMLHSCKCILNGKNKDKLIEMGECMYDDGGYFIIRGNERVLVSQERINYNTVYTFKQKVLSNFHL